jgi:serine/threonine-protein kinase
MRSEKQQVRSSASQQPFPEKVGAYELLLPIASGGMGTVYLARKRGPGGFEREVALKLTHAFLREQPEWTAELIEEAKLAARIRHTNVVQVMDVEDDAYGVFLVMQYVEGESLEGLLRLARERGERIPVDVGLRILLDALGGLHAAHELSDPSGQPLGLVHRDFTPQNILVGTDGIARLTDFGVAKAASRTGVTRTGVVKGKAPYMAPEQVRSMPLDRRADVWAAGVVAWELFAGRRMRPSLDDQAALLLQVATEAPPRLCTAREDAPVAVDEAVAQALTLDRARRCSSAVRFRGVARRRVGRHDRAGGAVRRRPVRACGRRRGARGAPGARGDRGGLARVVGRRRDRCRDALARASPARGGRGRGDCRCGVDRDASRSRRRRILDRDDGLDERPAAHGRFQPPACGPGVRRRRSRRRSALASSRRERERRPSLGRAGGRQRPALAREPGRRTRAAATARPG